MSSTEYFVCPECCDEFDDGDRLIDHLTDAHRLFHWATLGRPATGVEYDGP